MIDLPNDEPILYDALGKRVKLGNRYGYSNSSNGSIRVIFGTAVRLTNQRVTLRELEVKEYLYGRKIEPKNRDHRDFRSVSSFQLFPLNQNNDE